MGIIDTREYRPEIFRRAAALLASGEISYCCIWLKHNARKEDFRLFKELYSPNLFERVFQGKDMGGLWFGSTDKISNRVRRIEAMLRTAAIARKRNEADKNTRIELTRVEF